MPRAGPAHVQIRVEVVPAEDFLVAGSRRASVELFGVEGRQTRLAPPSIRHLAAHGPPSEEVARWARGAHVWCCPSWDPQIVKAALAYGCELMRDDPCTIFTIVVPWWEERRWWRKMLLPPTRSGNGHRAVYDPLRVYPKGARVLMRVNGEDAHARPVGVPLVVARLAAAVSAEALRVE